MVPQSGVLGVNGIHPLEVLSVWCIEVIECRAREDSGLLVGKNSTASWRLLALLNLHQVVNTLGV